MKKPLFNLDGTHLVMVFKRRDEYPYWPHCTDAVTTIHLAGTMHVEPFRDPWGNGGRHIRMRPGGEVEHITHKGWDWKPGGPCRFGFIDRNAP